MEVWRVEDGLPGNSVTSIVQTPDGYLWFGTFNGLVRFDGVRFKVMNADTPGLDSGRAVRLFVDRQGALWIAMEYGQLTRYFDGEFTTFRAADGWPGARGRFFSQESSGRLLISTAEGSLFGFDGTRFHQILPIETETSIFQFSVATDAGGTDWVRRGSRLGTLQNDHWIPFQITNQTEPILIRGLGVRRTGGIWTATDSHIKLLQDGRWAKDYGIQPWPDTIATRFLEEDSAGNLWAGTWGAGLFRYSPDGRFKHYSSQNGFPDDTVRCICEDREGSLWLGTDGAGLVRLKRRVFHSFDSRQGLPLGGLTVLAENPKNGRLTGALKDRLFELQEGQWTPLPNLPAVGQSAIFSILIDGAGRRWLGTYGQGLVVMDGNTSRQWTPAEGLIHRDVLTLFEDRDGAMWVGTEGGISRFANGRFDNYSTTNGLTANAVRAIAQDRDGSIWIGTTGGGLNRFRDGQFTAFGRREGLLQDSIRSLLADPDGSLWIGTAGGGLAWLKDGKFTYFLAANGLPDNEIAALVDDQRGNLWMGSNHGVFRVSREDLAAFARGEKPGLECTTYLRSDGLASVQVSAGSAAGLRSRDGLLWFATTRGVSFVDPAGLHPNKLPPLVEIEDVLADGVPQSRQPQKAARASASGAPVLKIPAGTSQTEFHYTALSLAAAGRNRFRFKLEGYTPGWTEAGTRRAAYFTKVPPGTYRFRVIAANNDGVWNETGASLAVIFLPEWWQTPQFQIALGLVLTGSAFGAYRMRIRTLTRAAAAREEFSRRLIASQEAERKRIAGELHDSLGQNLLVIKSRVAFAQQQAHHPEKLSEQLKEAASMTLQAIREVREISQNLRPFQLDELGLTKALIAMVRQVASASSIQFATDIADLGGAIAPESEINFYRVIQECLNNAVKHSQCTHCTVTITRSPNAIRASVSDNGRGFSPAELPAPGTLANGFGLASMTERVRTFSGRLEFVTRPGEGTTVIVEMPLRK